MVNVSVARRYARALIDVAAEASALDPVGEQLAQVSHLLADSKDLSDVLLNPAWPSAEKLQVVEKLTELLKLQPAVANLLRLLASRNRVVFINDIARLYRELADARAGRIRGKVTSAVALAPEQLKSLEEALEKSTQRDVVLEAKVDAALIGGVSAQVGSVVFDGSVQSQLEVMRRALKHG